MMDEHTIFANTILRGEVGSVAHGTNIVGTDDHDEMGIFMEPPEYVMGLETREHYVKRDQPEGVRSQPGDTDLVLYSMRKFCRLAVRGNPTVNLLLWLPSYTVTSPIGRELVELRQSFISVDMGRAFLGYMEAQRRSLTGERSPKVQRPELVEEFGFDTKFAMHALRLGFQGIELLSTNHLTIPMPEYERTFLLAVRAGKMSKANCLEELAIRAYRLKSLVKRMTSVVDRNKINDFIVRSHWSFWFDSISTSTREG